MWGSVWPPAAFGQPLQPRRLPPPGPNDVGALIVVPVEEGAAPRAEVLPPPAIIRLPPIEPIEPIPPAEPSPPWAGAVNEPLRAPATGPLAGLGEITFCDYCGDSCGGGSCCPGCAGASRTGRFARAVYRGLCCPDPCYQPCWRPRADAAFFTAAVRPVNQQRFRWDHAEDLLLPDRAEYLWARADGSGIGPNRPNARVDYDELRHYAEVAHGAFGAWVDYSYRSQDSLYTDGASPPTWDQAHDAGFGDLTIGTKTLLFDTDLVQMAFQFQTHVPAGSVGKGLGVGHTSLEPGLIFGLNLSPASYLQVELNEWIPVGGDPVYSGAIFRYNAAYNRVLARPHPCTPVIGSFEFAGWRFQDGAYTPAVGAGPVSASAESYTHASAGLRVFFCDRADFGVSYLAPLKPESWADMLIRTELRFRY